MNGTPRSRGWRSLTAAVVVAVAAGCGGSGASSNVVAPAAELLVASSDLGGGWKGESPRPFDPSTADLLRLCDRDVNDFGSATSVILTNSTRGDTITSIVGRFGSDDDAKAAVQRMSDAGTACDDWELDGAHVTIDVVQYGYAGQGGVAFRLVVTGGGRNVNADYFVWHRGSYAAAVLNTATVLLDPELTKLAINNADRLLVQKG